MVKKITIIPVNNNSNEEIKPQDIEISNVKADNIVEENIIKIEDDLIREQDEIRTNEILDEKLNDKPKSNGKKKMLNDMPTTEKVLSQVQCQACNKCMSAKNLKYSHAKFCIKREQDIEKPKAIPVPKKIIPKLKKILPVKGIQQDLESDDETDFINQITLSEFNNMEIKRLEALKKSTHDVRMKKPKEIQREYIKPDNVLHDEECKIFKGSIIPSDDIEIDEMAKLKNKITKEQNDYMTKHRKSELPMYIPTGLRPEDIEPTYEVRMKTTRQKKQEKYDKLALAAF